MTLSTIDRRLLCSGIKTFCKIRLSSITQPNKVSTDPNLGLLDTTEEIHKTLNFLQLITSLTILHKSRLQVTIRPWVFFNLQIAWSLGLKEACFRRISSPLTWVRVWREESVATRLQLIPLCPLKLAETQCLRARARVKLEPTTQEAGQTLTVESL